MLAFFQVLGAKHVMLSGGQGQMEETVRHVRECALEEPGLPPKAMAFRGSVVLVQEFGTQGSDAAELELWTGFIRRAAGLLRHMFNHGYPMRCAISFGEVPETAPEAAGDLAMAAYDLARQQDWSGGVLAPDSARRLWDLVGHEDPQEAGGIMGLLLRYPVPLRSGRQAMLALDWGREDQSRIFTPLGPLVREQLMRTFARNGKVLDAGAIRKADNTEAFLWHCRENRGRSWPRFPSP